MSHLKKYKDFYLEEEIGFREFDGVPTANGVDIYCENSFTEVCDRSCWESGVKCAGWSPDEGRLFEDLLEQPIYDEDGTETNDEVIDPETIDYTKDYFKPPYKEQRCIFRSDGLFEVPLDTTDLHLGSLIIGLKADSTNYLEGVEVYGDNTIKTSYMSRRLDGEYTYSLGDKKCSGVVFVKLLGNAEIMYVKIKYYYRK